MLLHICCGPCLTSVSKFLLESYEIVGYFYNPNIFPYKEWLLRYEAFLKVAKNGFLSVRSGLVLGWKDYFPKNILSEEEYNKEHRKFLKKVTGLENESEGGKRCLICFKLRLEEGAKFAKELGENIFATTLTVGKNKKAETINPIGKECAKKYGMEFYEADFKKIIPNFSPEKGDLKGFLESVKISKELGLYRQRYCGCEFSLR